MKSILLLLIACGALLSGCAVLPYGDGQGNGCPPGQAKKGNCRVDQYGNESFCPPGQADRRAAADLSEAITSVSFGWTQSA
ncbi:hypothetical protein AB4156_24820 [Cupriavidus sp. 2MCAB6]|uniref:hypothetical protein n=1 Tax=Cupriavidus sp. 2MCAB6 TaxID=3232981 RepID=UPI003F92940F